MNLTSGAAPVPLTHTADPTTHNAQPSAPRQLRCSLPAPPPRSKQLRQASPGAVLGDDDGWFPDQAEEGHHVRVPQRRQQPRLLQQWQQRRWQMSPSFMNQPRPRMRHELGSDASPPLLASLSPYLIQPAEHVCRHGQRRAGIRIAADVVPSEQHFAGHGNGAPGG